MELRADEIGEPPFVIYPKQKLNSNLIEAMTYLCPNIKSLPVSAGSSSKVTTMSFEREIYGNYTCKLGDMIDAIPAGRYADEYVLEGQKVYLVVN